MCPPFSLSSKILIVSNNLNKYKKAGVPNVRDEDIAFWIRQTLQGEKLDTLVNCKGKNIEVEHYARLIKMVKFDLVKITYLLFGSEVVRNPASLVHQQMMLDLIIDEKISWKDALDSKVIKTVKEKVMKNADGEKIITDVEKTKTDGGEMPMSMKEAVESARILHNKFFGLMPQGYMYDPAPTEASVRETELLQREHDITEKWFNTYGPGLEDEARIEILVKQIVRWYGIHLLWYTGDQINLLLNTYLVGNPIVVRPTAPLFNNDALTTAIRESLQRMFVEGNQAAVIPLNLGNNHWVSLTIRAEGNIIRAIYNDPLGNELSLTNRGILENAIAQAIQRIFNEDNININFNRIIDLELEQQTNGYDCGPITVNNLVRLALAENIDYSNAEAIILGANLITYDNQDQNIRQRHSEILLMEDNDEGEINPNNIDRLIELLYEERHIVQQEENEVPVDQMDNLDMDNNSSHQQQEDPTSDVVDTNSNGSSSPTSVPSGAPNSMPSFSPTTQPFDTTAVSYEQSSGYKNGLLSGESSIDSLYHIFDFK